MAEPEGSNDFNISPLGGSPESQADLTIIEDTSYRPKSADEANSMHRTRGDVWNRQAATVFGLAVVGAITVVALLTFLGFTLSTAQGAHEDAVRLLILVLGAILGALFRASTDRGE